MRHLTYLFLFVLLASSCNREGVDEIIMTPTVTPPTITVNGSVIGTVVDEDGLAIEDAIVRFGNTEITTTELGTFAFIDAQLFKDGTYVTVEKEGFFHGSRKFYAEDGESNAVQIRLMKKELTEEFTSLSGAKISFEKATVDLPSGEYLNEDGTPYTGQVKVFAQWLDPTHENTFSEMPGDLTGLDQSGEMVVLESYGMVAVELEGANGEELQLPEGEKAEIKLEVPQELLNAAPQTIPLWHFDEVNGSWIEEGRAELIDGSYIGEVSHFSFWNCDYPNQLITFSGTVLNNNIEWVGARVMITNTNTGTSRGGLTGANGYFTGKVPANQPLKLEIFDVCGVAVHSQNFQPTNADIILAPFNVELSSEIVTVSGYVSNCTGQQIDHSYAVVSVGESVVGFDTDANGYFEGSMMECDIPTADIQGVDVTNKLISQKVSFDYEGTVNVGTLDACDELIEDGWFVYYPGKNWDIDMNALVGYNIDADTIITGNETRIILEYTLIDWSIFNPQLDNPQFFATFDYVLGSNTANYTVELKSQGFEISGTCDYDEVILGNETIIRFRDVTTNITVTDSALYPPQADEVDFSVSFPKI